MNIICIGSSSKDIFFPTGKGEIVDTPEELTSSKKFCFELGAKYQVEDRFESIGGCAANVAAGLSRLGIKAGCYTKIGDDYTGKWIQDELEKEDVNRAFVEALENCASDLSAIIVDKKSGEHTIFFNRDANEKLEINPDNLKSTEWIFVSALNSGEFIKWEDNLEKILIACSESKIKLALNPGQSNIKENPSKIIEAIKKADILMVNKDEAIEILSGSGRDYLKDDLNDEKFLLASFKNFGPEIVTLTDGARGAWAYDGKEIIYTKTIGENPIETTGAGDAFSSGFLGAYLKGKSMEECLKWGIVNSGSSLNFYGATEGLLREERMLERIKEIKVEKIKK
ncbi:MAG: carbohydrate kinase family protein [bacterium]|nr:carbohydrate kinase family protein [bacterium]